MSIHFLIYPNTAEYLYLSFPFNTSRDFSSAGVDHHQQKEAHSFALSPT